MKKMIGLTYGSVTLKRSSRVLPLGIMTSSIKIRDELIPIDPLLLFSTIIVKIMKNLKRVLITNYLHTPFRCFLKVVCKKLKNLCYTIT